jgi:DNA uptake protein ComE-like DNA-binding protein
MNRSTVLTLFAMSACVLTLAACGSASVPAATTAPATLAPATEQATSVPAATTAPATEVATIASDATEAATTAPAAATTRVNLNTATDEEILTVPNTGQRMLREFKEYRPYTSILQFRQEIGKYVDDATVAEFEKYVYVPIDINNADAATLMQTGIDQAAAEAIIAARPFADKDTFTAKLGEFLSGEALAAAEAMVAQ